MRSHAASRLLALVALGALALALIVPAAFISTASAAEDTCTATSEAPDITLLKNDKPVTADNRAVAWEMLKLQFSLDLEDGHCAGQTYTISVPEQLRFDSGTTWDLNTEAGETAATMTYMEGEDEANPGRLVVTLTDFVESHQNVSLTGWLDTRLTSVITPGSTAELSFNTNGQTTTVEAPIGVCEENCTEMPTYFAKFGSAPTPNAQGVSTGSVTLQTPTVTEAMAAGADSVTLEWTDELTSANQAFTCDASAASYTGRDQWGDPTGGATTQVNVTSCTENTITGTVVVPVGQFARINLPMNFTGAGPWTDNASLIVGSMSYEREATVILRNGGGAATGNVPSAPTRSPSPSASPTSGAAPAAPSASPSPTGSESPAPAPSSETTVPTPDIVVQAPGASTTAVPSGPSLARTGANSLVLVIGAGALLVIGAGVIAVRRARTRK